MKADILLYLLHFSLIVKNLLLNELYIYILGLRYLSSINCVGYFCDGIRSQVTLITSLLSGKQGLVLLKFRIFLLKSSELLDNSVDLTGRLIILGVAFNIGGSNSCSCV